MTTEDLTDLVANHYDAGRRFAPGRGDQTYYSVLFTDYGHLLDKATRATLINDASTSVLAQWCATGVLTSDDEQQLRDALTSRGVGVTDLLDHPFVTGCRWATVQANPLLLNLMLSSPAYLKLLYKSDHPHRPSWANELNAALRAWLQPQLGSGAGTWLAFGALMEHPAAESTQTLIAAAHAANYAPAR